MTRRVVGWVLILMSWAVMAAADRPECSTPGGPVPNPAMNCPDRFAWEKFIEVVTPVAGQSKVAFQTYSTDTDTFPCPPADLAACRANPKTVGCPAWPQEYSTARPHRFNQRVAHLGRNRLSRPPAHLAGFDCWSAPNTEIVYRNRATFDYIVEHGLWYVENIQAQFEEGFVYDFPTKSLEVKANWVPLSQEQAESGRYYTMVQTVTVTDQSGKTVEQKETQGLVAMHISTKDLPNWFWSTFEHVDNPGRCDFLGCHDSFGTTPADVPARERQLCQAYPAGAVTSQLEAMFAQAHLQPAARYYRLKGAMVDFTDATGSPILVGNSVTEAGFVQTASCMTCHARAAVQATPGGPNGLSPYPGIAGFTPEGQSYNGAPNPEWYYSGNDPLRRWSVQTDFVWAIPFKAQSLAATAACCQAFAAGTGAPCQCAGGSSCSN